ncbi:hypothetical protein RJT34_13584 [Clitoria ternatea]|uniref:Uncharacterized protein n=1 Tax=Clitoria ternatea TaxID=43366 RepID=A0AAN9PLX7_CLITE
MYCGSDGRSMLILKLQATQSVGCLFEVFEKKGDRAGPREKEMVQGKVMSLCLMRDGFRIGASAKVNLSATASG